MNTTHPNIAVLQHFDPSNISAFGGKIAEDAVFHYYNPMLPEMHGDYHGRQGFIDFFEKIAGKTKETFKVTPLSVTPMGNELVVTHVKDNMTLDGQHIEVDAVVIWRIVDGMVKEVWDIPTVYTAELSDA